MNNYYTIEPTSSFQGVNYSQYQPESVINRKIQEDTNISSNWKYRQYIQKNANQIMKYNSMQSIYASGNNPYAINNNETVQNVPHIYASIHDTTDPQYSYPNTDLKQDYIKSQRMKSRLVSPSIPISLFNAPGRR
jgi:hypothetical protein